MKISRNKLRLHRKRRVRAKVWGISSKPRLCVFRSNLRIEVQIIDDSNGKTLLSVDSKMVKAAKHDIDGAREIGKQVAKKCLAKKIETVVFDRGGYKYHGKIKALAEGAREGGLKF